MTVDLSDLNSNCKTKKTHSSDKIKTSYSDLTGKVAYCPNWEQSVQITDTIWVN